MSCVKRVAFLVKKLTRAPSRDNSETIFKNIAFKLEDKEMSENICINFLRYVTGIFQNSNPNDITRSLFRHDKNCYRKIISQVKGNTLILLFTPFLVYYGFNHKNLRTNQQMVNLNKSSFVWKSGFMDYTKKIVLKFQKYEFLKYYVLCKANVISCNSNNTGLK